MGKVLIHLTMSLDGFIAKPNEDDWDWIFKHAADDSDDMGNRVMRELGAVVLGNKVYPVIFGNGLRLIDQFGCQPIDLERIEIISTTQITSMRFRVIG